MKALNYLLTHQTGAPTYFFRGKQLRDVSERQLMIVRSLAPSDETASNQCRTPFVTYWVGRPWRVMAYAVQCERDNHHSSDDVRAAPQSDDTDDTDDTVAQSAGVRAWEPAERVRSFAPNVRPPRLRHPLSFPLSRQAR